LGQEVLAGLKPIFKTEQPVIIYPASGSGAWEAALVNTLSPGDNALMCETGQFAVLWQQIAARLGIKVHSIETDWRHGADPEASLAVSPIFVRQSIRRLILRC
jgi:alanine-glyoxylate transaminase/serine-glyoxylate transaminase/serine-pyruvate transaminase